MNTTPRASVCLIAAVAANGVIGASGQIPWHSKEDLRHFARRTMGQVVVMGHKTYVSIGRPLSKRMTIVVTRDPKLQLPGCEVRSEVCAAIAAAQERSSREIFIIGGAELYRQTINLADKMEISHFDNEYPGDAYFPNFSASSWKITAQKHYEATPTFTIKTYLRR